MKFTDHHPTCITQRVIQLKVRHQIGPSYVTPSTTHTFDKVSAPSKSESIIVSEIKCSPCHHGEDIKRRKDIKSKVWIELSNLCSGMELALLWANSHICVLNVLLSVECQDIMPSALKAANPRIQEVELRLFKTANGNGQEHE